MDGFRMELWNACAKGSVDVVRAMVALPGVNVNARKYHNDTYLLTAASCGQAEVVRVLLGVPGIEANVADIFGTTPLCAACSAGHVEVVEALLESPEIRGVVNARKGTRMSRPEELTPLHHAIGGGHVEVVKALLGVPEVNVNVADSTGRTPLHAALRRGTTEIVEVLEAAGAIVSPTMHSAILDHDAEEVARQLAGGEWNAHRINSLHGTGGTVDETLLHVAAQVGSADALKLLLAVPGVDVNIQNRREETPLAEAAKGGHAAAVAVLLDAPAVATSLQDGEGQTPLHHAIIRMGRAPDCPLARTALVLLVSRSSLGVEANERDARCQRLLHFAVAQFAPEAVRVLLTLCPGVDEDVNWMDADGKTPLMSASGRGKTEIWHRSADDTRETPMDDDIGYERLQAKRVDIVRALLLAPGIDVNQADANGRTALHWAAASLQLGVVQELLADPRVAILARDARGKAPLDVVGGFGEDRHPVPHRAPASSSDSDSDEGEDNVEDGGASSRASTSDGGASSRASTSDGESSSQAQLLSTFIRDALARAARGRTALCLWALRAFSLLPHGCAARIIEHSLI